MSRLALTPSPAGLSLVETGSTKLRPNFYKTTKGEGISRKSKTESTNNKRVIKKRTRKSKTTHSRGRIISTIFRNCVGDNGHPLQNLLQTLQYLFFYQLKGRNHPRWVLSPRILKAKMLPLLQGLNSATHVARMIAKPVKPCCFRVRILSRSGFDGLELIACQGFFSQRSLIEGPELE
jgi:hypothetical protein